MTNFTTVKKYLLEINDLQGIDNLVSNKWEPIISELIKIEAEINNSKFEKDRNNKLNDLELFLDEHAETIYKILINAPTGISLKKNGNSRLVVLIILVLDELEFYAKEYWKDYLSFRYKAFTMFIERDLDAEAACILDSLRQKRRFAKQDSYLTERLNQQLKICRRLVNKKIEGFEKQSNFNQAQFLNSIYYVHPEYEFESRLQEKESKYLRMPLFEIAIGIVIPIILLTISLGLNTFLKNDSDNKVLNYLNKGEFSFDILIFGFFIIYITFWLFKVLEYSKISVRRTILYKILIVAIIVSSSYYYINNKYKETEAKYFPFTENIDTSTIAPKTKVLITEFNNVEKRSIFDKNNSEMKISKLFYKKILEKNDHNLWKTENLAFDYCPQSLSFKTEKDFKNKLTNNAKYDIIISGDIFSENEKMLYISNSCYIVNDTIKKLIESFDKRRDIESNTPRYDFLTLFCTPLEYYSLISKQDTTNNRLKYDIGSICGLTNYRIQGSFPQGVSFVQTINNSPQIIYYYISLLHLWKEYDIKKIEQDKLDSIIYCIDNISAISNLEYHLEANTEFKIHLCLLKSYFINEKIKFLFNNLGYLEGVDKQNTALNLWSLKVELMAKAIESSLEINNIEQEKIDFLIASFYYVNCNYLASILELPSRNNIPKDGVTGYNETYSNILQKNILRKINDYEIKYDTLKNKTYSDKYLNHYFSEMKENLTLHIERESWENPATTIIDSTNIIY